MKEKKDTLGYNAAMFEDGSERLTRTGANAQRAAAQGAAPLPVDNGLSFIAQDNAETLNQYATKTFLWMFLGLLTTFIVALGFFVTGAFVVLYTVPALPFILAIAELVVVFALSLRIAKMQASTARLMFFVYAVLNGVTFASLFAYYGVASTIYVFGITALYFGVLSLYGWLTKRDLTSLRPILFGGLMVLLVFWVLSIFLHLSGLETIMCFVGLAIFMGYTAYDTQKIKTMYHAYGGNTEMSHKTSIICALQLYLDFVNLFLYLLRIMGRRNSD
ncbi:MAG: Bax inhibitor-1/YccA family protein [Ruthenibacterium sp.]